MLLKVKILIFTPVIDVILIKKPLKNMSRSTKIYLDEI